MAERDELRKKGKSTKKKNAAISKARQRLGDEELLEAYYRDEWRTFQASDHFPLWVALGVDFTDDYLRGLA